MIAKGLLDGATTGADVPHWRGPVTSARGEEASLGRYTRATRALTIR